MDCVNECESNPNMPLQYVVLAMQPRTHHGLGWPGTPVSASRVLGLKVCVAMLRSRKVYVFFLMDCIYYPPKLSALNASSERKSEVLRSLENGHSGIWGMCKALASRNRKGVGR